eukprot:TRINITY_DN557_c0_g1_i4.p1 TRINITY_DN557_c0_g1~~TRINITY_DN557_c0_g1_i4.p1  ORF type:complete len:102 (+),score=27.53 TRINITY_DN557_c0_g1_i4:251-556(+)
MARRLVTNFKPMLDRVLVQRTAAVEKTAGGILLPESVQSKVNEGTVVSVGPGGRTSDGKAIPMSVAAGDSVLLPEYGGTSVKFDDQEYFIFRDDDLLGKFD